MAIDRSYFSRVLARLSSRRPAFQCDDSETIALRVTVIGGSFQSPTFQCKYYPARTSAPKCFVRQNLMARLKPPSHVARTLPQLHAHRPSNMPRCAFPGDRG